MATVGVCTHRAAQEAPFPSAPWSGATMTGEMGAPVPPLSSVASQRWGWGQLSPLNMGLGASPPACHQVARNHTHETRRSPEGAQEPRAGALCSSPCAPARGHPHWALTLFATL